jgi:hypothetical protein
MTRDLIFEDVLKNRNTERHQWQVSSSARNFLDPEFFSEQALLKVNTSQSFICSIDAELNRL